MRLEPLLRKDIPYCVAIEKEVFSGDSPWNAQAFYAELDAGFFYLAARTEEDHFAGYAGLALVGKKGDLDGELHTIAVDPVYQGKGIGTALLTALLTHADEALAPVFLEVRTDNAPAISLYERYGFTTIGLRENYYQPSGADAFVMKREVSLVDASKEGSEPTERTVH